MGVVVLTGHRRVLGPARDRVAVDFCFFVEAHLLDRLGGGGGRGGSGRGSGGGAGSGGVGHCVCCLEGGDCGFKHIIEGVGDAVAAGGVW